MKTGRQVNRQTEKRALNRQVGRQAGRQTHRHAHKHWQTLHCLAHRKPAILRHKLRHAGTQARAHKDMQAHRHTGTQAGR